MAKARNQWEKTARDAAARIDRDRDLGEQLTMLPDVDDAAEELPGKGRPKGAQNKGSSQMREWLQARGYRLPEDVIVQMAGLSDHADAISVAMAKAERILAWTYDGADTTAKKAAKSPTANMRLQVFMQVYTIQLRAAEAMLPYGAPKASPDIEVNNQTTFILSAGSGPADQAQRMRDVTPATGRLMSPPPLPGESQQKQKVSETKGEGSDE